ncbi:Crp/Fnr family transcriptional regulator [Desulforhopalus singaporensis]|uniref:Cyclic nucleotide-binding domain-containing protein n=1 Tax=Desulforhopalus singaporensis TaxID=91360 RepID=A0A1H0IX07_9BACT|nr:cyclic nucleotide-binding domain-containing protein [Desulforhopalus singaporensis]SDO36007.1 Cyclic nucleotide-binding domain-containing protein [Desulforhopalus singaporensis]
MEKSKLLAEFFIFEDFSGELLRELTDQVEIMEFKAGQDVFVEGQEAVRLYGLMKGTVELVVAVRDKVLKTDIRFEDYSRRKTESADRNIVVTTIGSHEIFGWSSLSPAGRYTSRAVCVEPVTVVAIATDKLREYFTRRPEAGYPFMEKILGIASRRFTETRDKLAEGWIEAFRVDRV